MQTESGTRYSMSTVSQTLADQLIKSLIETYASKGIDVRRALDNPLFKDLPLDRKVAAIEAYKNELIAPAKYKFGTIAGTVAGGAIAGIIATAVSHGITHQTLPGLSPGSALMGGLLGGALGIAPGSAWANKDYKHSKVTADYISDNKYLHALASRGFGDPGTKPENKILDAISPLRDVAYNMFDQTWNPINQE